MHCVLYFCTEQIRVKTNFSKNAFCVLKHCSCHFNKFRIKVVFLIGKYFSDLKSSKPQIMGLYWSKAQIEIRHSEQMAKVKKWLNNLWIYKNEEYEVFNPNKELSYADRVRRREPGDDTLGLSPHCDAGSVERWTDKYYQEIYKDIFSDKFEKYNPFDAKYRDRTIEFESPAVAHVFRTFQGWTALTEQGPNDGTLELIPVAKAMAYVLTRALQDDVPKKELCGSKLGRAFLLTKIIIHYF